jgi:hypothetical protein
MKRSAIILMSVLAFAACGHRNRGVDTPGTNGPAVEEPSDTVAATSLPAENVDEDVQSPVVSGNVVPGVAVMPDASSVKAVQVEGRLEFDKTVHDFGDILTTDGPKNCSFKVKNISSEPIALLEVVTSCGCTEAQWTREPLQPGKTGTISATYKNEDGPYPFDKTLTVYASGMNKPVILRLRGIVHEKEVPLADLYGTARIGDLGLKDRLFKAGNMEQGESRSDEARIANLGSKPLKLEFKDLSPQLTVSVEPNPIPAKSVAVMSFCVKADRNLWGRNNYYATPVINGKASSDKLAFWAVTKENFSDWDDEKRQNASQPIFDESTAIFDVVEKGRTITASFKYTNRGKSTFHIYKLDADAPGVTVTEMEDTPAGEAGVVSVSVDTGQLPEGDATIMMTLITNSPLRPIVNLFLAGVVK